MIIIEFIRSGRGLINMSEFESSRRLEEAIQLEPGVEYSVRVVTRWKHADDAKDGDDAKDADDAKDVDDAKDGDDAKYGDDAKDVDDAKDGDDDIEK